MIIFYFLVEDPFLVVVRDSIIYGISLNPDDKSNDAMVPVAGLQNGYDVDFDDSEQAIYWVEHPVSYCPEILFPGCYFFICYNKQRNHVLYRDAVLFKRHTVHVL